MVTRDPRKEPVLDPAVMRMRQPLLVTTVDAEESFDWAQPLSRSSRDLAAIGQQYLAHEIFTKHKVVPIYLVTYPVVSQEQGYRPLLEIFRSGNCEIGAQLHAWVTPPFDEVLNLQNSFAGNLPQPMEFEKLRRLTDCITERFERRPYVYRAGRYGLGPNTYNTLRQLGYRVDTSVVPEQSYAANGGPSFFGLQSQPCWTDESGTLLELPLTCAFVGMLGRSHIDFARWLYSDDHHYRFARGFCARTRLLERIRLTPEGTTVNDAKRLVRALRNGGLDVFVLSYHAPSLVVGNTPYVRSITDRDDLLRWLDEFYEFFFNEIGGAPATTSLIYDMMRKSDRPSVDKSREGHEASPLHPNRIGP